MKNNSNSVQDINKVPAIIKAVIIFFIIGITAGYVTGSFLKTSLYSPLIDVYNDILSQMSDLELKHTDILYAALKRNFKYCILLYIFSVTNLWNLYCSAFVLYTGFSNGLFMAFNVIIYGITGSIQYICYQFPQALFFIPLYLLIIMKCHSFHRHYYGYSTTKYNDFSLEDKNGLWIAEKGKILLKQFPFIIVSILFIALGCMIEAWLNLPFVLWYLAVP